MQMTIEQRCGVTTKAGKACRQPVNVLPCEYHDRENHAGVLRQLRSGLLSVCGPCLVRYDPNVGHSCPDPAAEQIKGLQARVEASR